jgi:thioesterase domain-containing protein
MSIADLDSAGLASRPGIAMFIPGSGGVGSIRALNDRSFPTLILPGAGGDDAVNPAFFCSKAEHAARFQTIGYPGWRRYVETGFSADGLIEHLAAQIALRAPEGPIRIIGISLGGHLGYAAALHLQASGREIGGFCAIDACMTTSASRMAGWKGRALREAAGLLRDRRLDEFGRFLRSRFWRALFRLTGTRLVNVIRRIASSDRQAWILGADPIFGQELSMRLLIREVAPWIALLDREQIALRAPAVFFRTYSNAEADSVWRRRCPGINIVEMPGDHHTLLDHGNPSSFRETFVIRTKEWY